MNIWVQKVLLQKPFVCQNTLWILGQAYVLNLTWKNFCSYNRHKLLNFSLTCIIDIWLFKILLQDKKLFATKWLNTEAARVAISSVSFQSDAQKCFKVQKVGLQCTMWLQIFYTYECCCWRKGLFLPAVKRNVSKATQAPDCSLTKT